ncbi:hypothetical protein [Arenibaculum pallidiluteum]|uniref:hypothetical protein n=1 Tax=Arenibaculum pallidiluteum TaxID=2812559 RepID=UPI001A975D89|nr:hypothetical protein [Arenibaculum pallidiluteum]
MDLRICFENQESVNVNDSAMMRHYAESYLADYRPEWAGFVMLPHDETRRATMEPVWQVLVRDATARTEADLLDYIARNPMAAYHVHVYRKDGVHEAKLV